MTLAEPRRRLNSPALPRLWLVTDPQRLPDPRPILARLPGGSGVILRHPDAEERTRWAKRLMPWCRRRRLVLLVANDWRLAAACGAAGVHLAEGLARSGTTAAVRLWCRRRRAILSVAAHSHRAIAAANALKADQCLLSQAFASASHPGRAALGPLRFALLARHAHGAVIALGGVTRRNWRRLPPGGAHGWAAIDGLK